MPIDTNIYQNIKPIEMPSYLDSQQKAANLSALAMQQKHMGQQMQNEDQAAKMQAHLQKAQVFGNTLEGLSGLSPQERAVAYPQVRQQMIQEGVIKPEDAPEEHDEGFYRQSLMRYRQTAPAIENQLKKAHAAFYMAESQQKKQELENPKKSLTPGELKADEQFGKEVADYYYGGGKASVEKNVEKLQGAINKLNANPKLTGGLSTRIPLLDSDAAQDSLNPEMASVRDEIRGAIQGSLRATLGAQFTEKEGQAIFNRSFNPRLSPAENVKRATAELEAIKRMAAQKDASMERFISTGTLKGYQPQGTMLASAERQAPPAAPGSGLVPEAVAAEEPMIRMVGPNGKIKMVPLSKKGEAIAAGGKVVK